MSSNTRGRLEAGDLAGPRCATGHGLAARAVTLVALPVRLALARAMAQVLAHLGAHRPLNQCPVQRAKHRLQPRYPPAPSGPLPLIEQFLRDVELTGSDRLGRRLGFSRHIDSCGS